MGRPSCLTPIRLPLYKYTNERGSGWTFCNNISHKTHCLSPSRPYQSGTPINQIGPCNAIVFQQIRLQEAFLPLIIFFAYFSSN